jgi:hypothetical protein
MNLRKGRTRRSLSLLLLLLLPFSKSWTQALLRPFCVVAPVVGFDPAVDWVQ